MSATKPWLSIGLYAEGPTDDRFFGELLPRLVRDLAHERFGPDFIMSDDVVLLRDRPSMRAARLDERVASAIGGNRGECSLFVIHTDGDGDPVEARAERVAPAITLVGQRHEGAVVIGCVPVRETEAWLLADGSALARIFRWRGELPLPRDPEAVADPKRALQEVLEVVGRRARESDDIYTLLGRQASLAELDRLPAARVFRADLAAALERLAPPV